MFLLETARLHPKLQYIFPIGFNGSNILRHIQGIYAFVSVTDKCRHHVKQRTIGMGQ